MRALLPTSVNGRRRLRRALLTLCCAIGAVAPCVAATPPAAPAAASAATSGACPQAAPAAPDKIKKMMRAQIRCSDGDGKCWIKKCCQNLGWPECCN